MAVVTPIRAAGVLFLALSLRKTTGRQRGRCFAHDRYLTILNEGTEPL